VPYQAILEEGRVQGVEIGREEGREEGREAGLEEGLVAGRADEARRILFALGTKRFGKPSTKVRRTVAAITEPAVLEGLVNRLLDVGNWADLLAE
jgi:flagellar biosynthesis/type III secretory pathway protein FliH